MNWHLVEGSGMKGFVGVLAICPSIDVLDIERGFRGLLHWRPSLICWSMDRYFAYYKYFGCQSQ